MGKRANNVVNLERWLYVKARPGIVLYKTVKEAVAAMYPPEPPKPEAIVYDLTAQLPIKKAMRAQAKMRRDARAEEDRIAAERGEEFRALVSICDKWNRQSIAKSKALLAGHRELETGDDVA